MVLTRATSAGPTGLGTATTSDRQHHDAVGRPEPDLHLAPLAPGVPARVRARRGRQARSPPASCSTAPATADGMATWAEVKAQAATMLGIDLTDDDVAQHPAARDRPVRQLHPRRRTGLPQYRRPATGAASRATSRNPAHRCPANVAALRHAVPDDIAHNAAVPGRHRPRPGTPTVAPTADADNTAVGRLRQPAGRHLRRRDARRALHRRRRPRQREHRPDRVHQVFHSEHNRLVEHIKDVVLDRGRPRLPERVAAGRRRSRPDDGRGRPPCGWNGERLFQAARFVTEMEYQHLVFEEFARKVQPDVDAFVSDGYQPTSTRRSSPSSPTRSTASATRC